MTVASETTISGPFAFNGSATTFAYGFRILADTDLEVVEFNTSTGVLSVFDPDDYAVTGVGDPGGGNVVFDSAPASGSTGYARRKSTFTQQIVFTDVGAFQPSMVMSGLDRVSMFALELREEVHRSVRGAIGETFDPLPPAAFRANKVLSFDDDGAPEVSISSSDIAAAADAAAAAVAAAASIVSYGRYDVTAYGAVGDGDDDGNGTDDTDSFIAARDAAGIGATIRVPGPNKNYILRDFHSSVAKQTWVCDDGATITLINGALISDAMVRLTADEVRWLNVTSNGNRANTASGSGGFVFAANDCEVNVRDIYEHSAYVFSGTGSDQGSRVTGKKVRDYDNLTTLFIMGATAKADQRGPHIDLENIDYHNEVNVNPTQLAGGIVVRGNEALSHVVTTSIASPCVVGWTAHGRTPGDPFIFTNVGGALPTGLVSGQTYFVKTVLSVDTLTVAATIGGAVINTSGSQSGVHTAHSRAYYTDVYVKTNANGIDNPWDSTCCNNEIRTCRHGYVDIRSFGAGMSASTSDLLGTWSGGVRGDAWAFWGFELGGANGDLVFTLNLDGRDANGVPRGRAAILNGDTTTEGVLVFSGALAGVSSAVAGTDAGVIYHRSARRLLWNGDINCEGATYAIFDLGAGNFTLNGTQNAGSTGEYVAYMANSPGNALIDGRSIGFSQGFVWIDNSSAVTTVGVDVRAMSDTLYPNPIKVSLAGGGAIGARVGITGWHASNFKADKNTTNQASIADATFTKITFTHEVRDHAGDYDAANSKYIPKTTRPVEIFLQVNCLSALTYGIAAIYKNGAQFAYSDIGAATATSNGLFVQADDTPAGFTDYYEAYAYLDVPSGTATVSGAISASYFRGKAQ